MVRHYVPKHKAWQPHIWITPDLERDAYVPTYQEKILKEPEPEVLTWIRSLDGDIKEPGSREEWRVSRGLNYYSLPFYYQYSIAGGRKVRGGQIIDFYVETVPTPTLVWVQGAYWHTGTKGSERTLLISQAESYFNGKVRTVEIWDYEVKTVEDAVAMIKQRVL